MGVFQRTTLKWSPDKRDSCVETTGIALLLELSRGVEALAGTLRLKPRLLYITNLGTTAEGMLSGTARRGAEAPG